MKFVLNQPWADFAEPFMSRERWSRPASRFDPEGVGASKPADEGERKKELYLLHTDGPYWNFGRQEHQDVEFSGAIYS